MTAALSYVPAPTVDQWQALADAWLLHLRGRNMSPATQRVYLTAVRRVADWARANGRPDPTVMRRRDFDAWLADAADQVDPKTGRPRSPATTHMEYRALSVFYVWLLDEEEIDTNPMAKVRGPIVPERPTEILTDDDLARLLATCAGRSFTARRDMALLRVLLDTGIRMAELDGLSVDDVDLLGQSLLVTGKGRKGRRVPFGIRTAEALSRYLRSRATQPGSHLADLWLARGTRPLGRSGIHYLIKRHADEAGIQGSVHAHRFRHTSYNAFAEAGGNGQDAMAIYGWQSERMLSHYAKSNAERRALSAGHRLSPGDRV